MSTAGGGGTPTTTKTGSALNDIQVVLGLLAGIAALIYLAGGAALGLRLLFAGLPTLPVGQLPREFLFSLGAAQVVMPALVLGVMVGLLELGQRDLGLRDGHLPWNAAKDTPQLRRTYLAFYAAIPFVLITPGVAIAALHDDKVGAGVVIGLAAAAVAALEVWRRCVRDSRLEIREGLPKSTGTWGLDGWLAIGSGGAASAVFAFWLFLDSGSAKYFGILGAWLVSLFFALLVVWLRSQAGERRRRELRADSNKGVSTLTVILSWSATAVLAVPSLIAVTAAWPLSDALVCTQPTDSTVYDTSGPFVGETKDRVYIGNDDEHRIISVPTSNVTRLVVGSDLDDIEECARTPAESAQAYAK